MAVVEMRGVSKRFGSLVANDQIDLDIASNEIHALLGENGAGKSTLMKILYGFYQPDEGEILVEGKPVTLKSPVDAIRAGIGLVSQHFSLVPTFTVAENIVLGFENTAILNHDKLNQTVADTARRYGFTIEPNAVVRDLSVGQQQRVEILKALYRQCRVLILDEPTAVLTPRDAAALFDTLRQLQKQNLSVIIITHKLEEVMAISQRVTVLRLGKVAGREVTAQTNPQALARLMVGRNVLEVTRNTEHIAAESIALAVNDLSVSDKRGVPALRNVSFDVHAGEVVGIAGIAGNGQSELVAVLGGLIKPDSGEVLVSGQPVELGDPRSFNQMKVARIPEDRLKGVVGDLSVAENLALEQIGDFTRAGHLNHKQMRQMAQLLIADFQIKAEPGDRVRTLSGGNIQKVILARTLSRQPDVVIAAQPTRGLDIGATEYVHQKLLEQKARGAGVLLVSEDLDETRLLSDRILVIYAGSIVGEFSADEIDIDQISLLMAGSKAAVK
ncbi:MAG: ATP-binding cassette domain-containing protein [Anaerolineaceae bacterium]|nr:ATP-binding cassette domain-containing protein [Anaerolineaceae bacterium]